MKDSDVNRQKTAKHQALRGFLLIPYLFFVGFLSPLPFFVIHILCSN